MLFHTLEFALFFAIVYPLYLVLSHRLQNRMLLIASYVFYGAWDWRFLSLLIISSVTDYLCALAIDATDRRKTRKFYMGVSIAVNAGLLGTFKYYDFFAAEFQSLMTGFGIGAHPYFLDIALPIGISFYTFQTMSYTIDVYRRDLKPTRDFLDFSLYVSFFPQLIAGPIERGISLMPQISNPRTVTLDMVYRGLYLVLWGLFLKVVIADNMSPLVDPVFAPGASYGGADVMLAAYAFSFQIYGDFAGYSFIALGISLMMGIQLTENFKRPYLARNITEFWRRWHISLSNWFRDYVYIPLGGRKHAARNSLIVFVVCGLWHGANWTFLAWGLFHGTMIWAYYAGRNFWDRLPVAVQIFLLYQIVCIGWIIFRAETLSQAMSMIGSIGSNFAPVDMTASLNSAGFLLAIVAPLVLIQLFQERTKMTLVVLTWPRPVRYGVVLGLFWVVLLFGVFDAQPFIYFQF